MKKLLLILVCTITSYGLYAQDAVYKIEFISNWSSSTHPNNYPSGSAHWSPLVGATHNSNITFFEIGALATNGVESIAETGSQSTFQNNDVDNAITSGNADQYISGSGLGTGPGTITIEDLTLQKNFPLISLITMIAPSPDWVAMVNDVKLTDNDDNWLNSLSIVVHAVDAGTDDGASYGSGNAESSPHVNMSSLENSFPFSSQSIGTFVFTLQSVLSTEDVFLAQGLSVYPNPSNGAFTIANNGSLDLEKAELYAVSGKKIKEVTTFSNQTKIQLSNVRQGLYFLKVQSSKGVLTKKIVIK